MKQSKFIRECGPYEVHSISQDAGGVRLEVFPAFPQDDGTSWDKEPRWIIHRLKGEGGGPGIFEVIALAKEFEAFLNQSYSGAAITAWKETLNRALKEEVK